ncbi:MAG: putative toxin-antitoxin system toxin component, PIN family [Pirellulales bacterium]|nr:putative toxin-antitoxin system toxin component, PIN family [Pirellulales bacterium]
MKLVLDTNVLIASLIARGACTDLLEHCVLSHTIVASDFIFLELQRHLVGKFKYSAQEADEAIALLGSQMEIVEPKSLRQAVCRDPDDDQILATAIAGQVKCVVTGDKDLLVLRSYEGIAIISPRDFADFETLDENSRRM